MIFYKPHSSLTAGSRVTTYLRDSGGDNQEDSIERQEAEVRRWCAQYGLVLTTVFTDEARTAKHSLHKRKDLLSMMAHFRNGGDEQGVIIWNYERFARNIKHGRHFLAELESLDKVVCSLTDDIPEGPERYFIQDLKLWSAEQTSVKISIDVTSGLRRMVQVHRGVPGIPPRGFRRSAPIIIGKHRNGEPRIVHAWEPDPDLIQTVRLAFEMRARGATLKQIMSATHLFPTINSWKTFFNNRIYIGILKYGDLIIEDYCDPIVTMDVWNKVQEVGKKHARITTDYNPRRSGSTFLLSGIAYCQECGSLLNGRVIAKAGDKRRAYYYCLAHDRGRTCHSRNIPAKIFEDAIITALEDKALDLETLLNFQARVKDYYDKQQSTLEGERKRLRHELTTCAKRIKNITDAIADRGSSRALLDSLNRLEIAESTLRVEFERLENFQPPEQHTPMQLSAMADEIKSALHGEDINKKKHAIQMLTARIVAKRANQQINAVIYYVPTVCVGESAPTLEDTVHIQIIIPKYTRAER